MKPTDPRLYPLYRSCVLEQGIFRLRGLNLNGLLVICQIDNLSLVVGGGGGARREISPWLSQEMRTWTRSHQTFQHRRSENQGGHSSP